MKFLSIAASIIASVATVAARAQGGSINPGGPEQPCTYTATSCTPLIGPTETITVYEVPHGPTSTVTYDCQGCQAVSVTSKFCLGQAPIPIQTTTFLYTDAASTVTEAVCSPTP